MKTLMKFKVAFFAIAVAGIFTACSSDDDSPNLDNNRGKLGVYAKANYTPSFNRGGDDAVVELSSFWINIEEIELEYDDVIDQDNFYNSDDDIELQGPFALNILSPEPIEIINVNLPNGRLEEIEFEFGKNSNPDSDLYRQSMRMEGTINGTPFVFWHDFEDEIELEFDDDNGSGLIIGDENGIVITFDLNDVLNPTLGVDLSSAVDGNGDGVIEIGPRDSDGNQALAEAMKRAIKNQIELLEDLYD